jgi:hypothetical protein
VQPFGHGLSEGLFLFGYDTKRRRGFQTIKKGGERMKTGLIIYVVGNDRENFIDEAKLQGQIPAWADIVEIVAQNNGHYDIHDAWWKLIARGMQRIICKIAEINDSEKIILTQKELRLCG